MPPVYADMWVSVPWMCVPDSVLHLLGPQEEDHQGGRGRGEHRQRVQDPAPRHGEHEDTFLC